MQYWPILDGAVLTYPRVVQCWLRMVQCGPVLEWCSDDLCQNSVEVGGGGGISYRPGVSNLHQYWAWFFWSVLNHIRPTKAAKSPPITATGASDKVWPHLWTGQSDRLKRRWSKQQPGLVPQINGMVRLLRRLAPGEGGWGEAWERCVCRVGGGVVCLQGERIARGFRFRDQTMLTEGSLVCFSPRRVQRLQYW